MIRKISALYRKTPNRFVIAASTLTGFLSTVQLYLDAFFRSLGSGYEMSQTFWGSLLVFFLMGASQGLFIVYPLALTVQNICQLCTRHITEAHIRTGRITDMITFIWGMICVALYQFFAEIRFADWTEILLNDERHTPVATWTMPTIVFLVVLGIAGYVVLRYVPLQKLPPLACVLAMAAMYLGALLCILFTIQLSADQADLLVPISILSLYPFNLLLVCGKTVRHVCSQYEQAKKWPWMAFLLMWPLLGLVVAVLLLFGQKPDSIIQAWTQTSDWALSQQQAPQNVMYDEHYLCTVAAGGHPEVVKPLRMGERHGHRIVVNRQLLVANAFEDLLMERLPGLHKKLRAFYDAYGYPVSRHIKNRFAADMVYVMMKPLEYFFILVLYLFDAKPEDRIAMQYLGSTGSALKERLKA